MSNINKAAVLNPFTDLTANILDYVPRATTSEFGIVAIGSGINVDALGRIYLDTQEYSDRLTAIEAQAASTLYTQQSEVAAAIAQVNLTQSQTITALTLEVGTLKTNLTDSITATQTDLVNRADQLAQDVTDITVQLTQDKATFIQDIQDALDFLKDDASVASALRTPRKIQGVDCDGTQDISLPTFTAETDGLVPKRIGATADNYLREDGTWVVPTDTTYALLTQDSAEDGTATTANTISAQVLKEAIQYHAPTVTNIAGNAESATKLQTPRTISLTGNVTGSVSFDGSTNASIATTVTGLGAANGIATLDSNGQVPSAQLPSYVDDVLEYINVAAFPTTGVAGKIYVETAGNTTYRWGGSGYVKITSGEVSSVAGKTGVVTLTKADVGLANVDNTPDAQKPISTATQLALNGKVNKSDVIAITNGGTGASTAEGARANLGISTTKLSLVQLATNTDEAFINAMTSGDKSGFFFDSGTGKATFAPYSVGMFSSLLEGGFFGIGADVTSGAIKTMSGVKRPAGNIDLFSSKELLSVGAYGLGASLLNKGHIGKNVTGINPDLQTGFYEAVDIIGSMVALKSPYGTLLIGGSAYSGSAPQYVYYNSHLGNKDLLESKVHTFRTTQNTWVDGNGFIKAASPVVELYANEIKLNNEAKDQDIVFEKVDVGSYLLKGTAGLAQDGWYIEQPKDSNGNIFHAVEYGTHDNGDMWIKTYEQIMEGTRIVADHTKPVDIKENRFITLRLNELPKDTTAPPNPTVIDSEGNPAPSKYHKLEEGVWTLSEESAAILEQERLTAMPALKRRQFRLTLVMNGYDLNEIEALIDQIEDPMQRTIAQIEWQDATDFERNNPTLLMMIELLQLTSEQVDQLWSYGLAL